MTDTTIADEDLAFLIRHAMTKGYQAFSLLAPPCYVLSALYRRGRKGISINNLLRTTWIAGGVGTTLGGAAAWFRLKSQPPESLYDRRFRLMHNVSPNSI
ncbi:hypothetical protein M422DRAFT_177593 [Sphaerobolus stellatus SS14]|uniref:Uncharacterized protein n=1 Tax=Sphaerobolus stellatus (strain SS14) TaxID=990650 RepID=A0A0C9VJT4_SPHS4|nr:hypothetical protein M422DRAFT_177593 [Sphaerobolus stellatus SS14]